MSQPPPARASSKPENPAIEAYLAAVPEPAQTRLRELRAILLASMPPDIKEVISYGIPAFSLGRPFFGYAAFRHHCSVFAFSGSFFDTFAEELEPYSRTKSSLHLPFDRPLPRALLGKLVRTRLASLPTPKSRSAKPARKPKLRVEPEPQPAQ